MTLEKTTNSDLYLKISTLISNAHHEIRRAVNTAIVNTYWSIGMLIVEDEQGGENRVKYGKSTLKELSGRLTSEFGKGFDVTNLRKMRQFYNFYPKRDSVSLELSWTHYRHLLKVENDQARHWYMKESVKENRLSFNFLNTKFMSNACFLSIIKSYFKTSFPCSIYLKW